MNGPGSLSQMARVIASIPDDTPIADRDDFDWGILALADPEEKWGAAWSDLGDALEQHGRDIDEARAAHRSDCLARYGEDIFGDGK